MKKEINIFVLIKHVYKKYRKRYFLIMPLVFLVSSVFIIGFPRYYTAHAEIIPESSKSSGLSLPGNLSSLASLAGVNMSSLNGSDDAIQPELYPSIFNSTTFLADLASIEVQPRDGERMTFYHYMAYEQKSSWWTYPIEWLKGSADEHADTVAINPHKLTRDQDLIFKSIKKSLDCKIDKRTGLISLSTLTQDPEVAAQLADSVMAKLQTYIIEYRTRKARVDVDYMSRIYTEAQAEYRKAQDAYAHFVDTHQDLVLSRYKVEEERLENEVQLAYAVFSQAAQQQQLALAKLQERTPAFSIIQSAVVPIKPAAPKRMVFVAGMLVLAFIILSAKYLYLEYKTYA